MPKFPLPEDILKCNDLTTCFQSVYNFLFGIFIVFVFLYFFYGAFEYLLSGASITKKESGKKKMTTSLTALIVVLIIPIIVNLVNPGIFKGNAIKLPSIKVTLPQIKIYAPETSPEDKLPPQVKPIDYPPDKNLTDILKSKKVEFISKMEVDCFNKIMTLYDQNKKKITDVGIAVGENGCKNDNTKGNKATLLGKFTITNPRYNPGGIFSNDTGAYLGTRTLTYYPPRGLLIHGGKGDNLTPTYGCIRMKDSQLAAIFDFIKPNVTQLEVLIAKTLPSFPAIPLQ